MKTRAAAAWKAGAPPSIETVDTEGLFPANLRQGLEGCHEGCQKSWGESVFIGVVVH